MYIENTQKITYNLKLTSYNLFWIFRWSSLKRNLDMMTDSTTIRNQTLMPL